MREYAEKLREYAEKLREKIARKGGEIAGIHTCNSVPTLHERSRNLAKFSKFVGWMRHNVNKCDEVSECSQVSHKKTAKIELRSLQFIRM